MVLLIITFIGNSESFTMCWSLVMTIYFDDLTYSSECVADGIAWVSYVPNYMIMIFYMFLVCAKYLPVLY